MKNKSLKQFFQSQGGWNNENEVSILNPEYVELLYGGSKEYNECTTHSGDCSELTKCGTYGSDCNSKCFIKVSAI